jgi:Planctomycete cytochrome C
MIENMKNLILTLVYISTTFTGKVVAQTITQTRFMYQDAMLPILEKKCYGCHSEVKQKGDLRLDCEAFIRQGSKNGSILTAGNPQKTKCMRL